MAELPLCVFHSLLGIGSTSLVLVAPFSKWRHIKAVYNSKEGVPIVNQSIVVTWEVNGFRSFRKRAVASVYVDSRKGNPQNNDDYDEFR
ncbi:hypothetical protein C5167_016210 [Papaver somniferum]|nr:hypothetical protein C5167_016210 [Papaver somniferum]